MAFTPNNITKDHVLKAVAKIEEQKIDLIPSTKWLVEINGKHYPPKEVMRFAHEQMNGEKVWEYGGGNATNRFLSQMGFLITEINGDPVRDLIKKYKEHLKANGLKGEIYKWQLLHQFQGRPDVNASDLFEEIKSINFSNLIFHHGFGVAQDLAKNRPEPYRECFKVLFDESRPIIERVKYFNEETLKIYREINTKVRESHHQDERTIATFLTFHNPEKYSFYKDSFYQKYCRLIGVKSKSKGEKYVHYLDLLDDFINDYIIDDNELLDLFKKNLSEDCFQDKNYKILAQNILFSQLDNGIEELDIENKAVYKISMGEFSDEEIVQCLKDKKIIVHKDTKGKGQSYEKQGELFEKMNIGDYFYMTHGNGYDRIKLFGQIKGEAVWAELNDYGDEGWLERSYELIANSINKNPYKGISKWWSPNNNSTCIQIKKSEFEEANKVLFEPYFNIRIIAGSIDNPIDDTEKTESKDSGKELKFPLNQILFGPPGTGKTYNTVNKALEISGIDITGKQRKEIKGIFDTKLKEGQIVFTTFHQSMSYEDFIEGIKPLDNNGKVFYETLPGIFKSLCSKASLKIETNFSDAYNRFIKSIGDSGEPFFQLATKTGKPYWIGVNSNGNLNIHTTEEKNFQGTMTKEKLERFADGENTFVGWEGYATGIIKHLKEKFQLSDNTKETKKKNFVLIIDEINRGNVSQIFGELITLIEEDKRIGKDEALEVVLPYSKEKFSVPSNLYIIGTMNTADRSVEAIDTALRRRFSFEEIPPKYDLKELDYEIAGHKAAEILKTINTRIEKLLDKDHAIGHSYFMLKIDEQPLEKLLQSFYKNIIPLLQEYFYGDFGKIGLVLGSGFVNKKIWDKNTDSFADFEHESSSEFDDRDVFEIIDYRRVDMDYSIKIKDKDIEMTFEKALKRLMKEEIE